MLNKLVIAVRWRDWKDTKIPFYLIFFTKFVSQYKMAPGVYLFEFFYGLVFMSLALCVGHMTNDFCDQFPDKVSGKPKSILNKGAHLLFWFLFVTLIMFSIKYNRDVYSWCLFSFYLVVGLSYSIHPFRFKERGFLGIVLGAVSQRILPLLPIIYYWHIQLIKLLPFLLLSFLIGTRQMYAHQIKDFSNDIKGKVHTYIRDIGLQRGLFQLQVIVVLECIMLAIFVLIPFSPVLVCTLVFYICWFCAVCLGLKSYRSNFSIVSSNRFYLSTYYYLLLPVVCALLVPFPSNIFLSIITLMWQRFFIIDAASALRKAAQ